MSSPPCIRAFDIPTAGLRIAGPFQVSLKKANLFQTGEGEPLPPPMLSSTLAK